MKASKNEILNAHIGLKRLKWNEIYNDESELIEDLKSINIRASGAAPTRGYQYLLSFQKSIKSGLNLTDKQMTQLKRLAVSVAYEKLTVK